MVAHCLYRTVFVVGAVLARLVLLLALVDVTSCSVGALETSAPPKSAPPKVTTGCPSLLLMHRARLLKSLREHLRGT